MIGVSSFDLCEDVGLDFVLPTILPISFRLHQGNVPSREHNGHAVLRFLPSMLGRCKFCSDMQNPSESFSSQEA